ncbi:Glyco hydro 31 and/or Gal mutarotas 2 domain containing protein [Asbolus verrucosus]|uniref:Glucosidase II subunit alpha n=1 Tax=Asbolus verrucosus TaxID=1661398 RepID=A0A482WCF4_ASBVE|nr:Glyco hydro 31 and/or Gal mutarotas 2 domain containing protein [Asbolus verrucosus]
MFGLFLFITFTITLGSCANHDIFKNCSRVEFCANFRSLQPSDNYVIDAETISVENGSSTLTATLKSNNQNSDLTLVLSGLQHSTFRLKITEVNSTRYELKDVLSGEPELLNFANVKTGDGFINVTSASHSNYVTIYFSPFSIRFSREGVPEIIFSGDRLVVTKNAPFTFGITYPQAIQLYGLHEHCASLALRNTGPGGMDPYRLKNSDTYAYEIESPMALYGAIPVLYGHGATATAGVFLHNAAEQWIEINNQGNGSSQAYFMVESGALDLFILLGPKPVDVVRQYTALTGTAHLPQLWTLGYHQCRYSYDSQDLVKEVIANFDSHDFQLDAIWLDIDYTDSYKYFTWNSSTFSDPTPLLVTFIVACIPTTISYQECLNANILGLVFCGADVGGFINNPNDELFQRWYQAAAWLPFFRAHSAKDTPRREPYLKSEEVQSVLRSAIQTRYKHLPQWYTLFYEHTRTGDPIIRPLFYQYPEDTKVYQIDNQLLVGSDILVRAVTEPGVSSVQVYFPGGADEFWFSAEGDDVYAGNGFVDVAVDIRSIPVFYRKGSVVVRKDTVRPNTAEMARDGFTLYVTLDANNKAYGRVYLDDNTSFNYRDSAEYNYIEIIINNYDNITVHEIDTNSNGNFTFAIDGVVYKSINNFPEANKPGSYKNVAYTKDANGNLLKDIKIYSNEKTT